MKHLFFTAVFIGMLGMLQAQCPQFIHCETVLPDQCITANNNAESWNQVLLWDPIHNLHNLAEGPVSLVMSVKDSCAPSAIHISYALLLDLDGDGSRETAVWSDSLPPSGTVYKNNAVNPNFSGGTPLLFDQRQVQTNSLYRFALETELQGDVLTARVRLNSTVQPNNFINPSLPLGNHEIRWYVESGGVKDTCIQFFEMVDCQKPTVVCVPGISTTISPSLFAPPLWVADLLLYTIDNACPSNLLTVGIRKAGTGTGFPLDTMGNPLISVIFNCNDVGTIQPMEVWSLDKFGNTNFCVTNVYVNDNAGFCNLLNNSAACAYNHCNNESVTNVWFEIFGTSPSLPAFTFESFEADGCWDISSIPVASNYGITLSKNDNPLNGVSTYDLVLMQKHLLGVVLLDSPYKLIAADANKNGSITATDIVEIRKLILGISTQLPAPSWRFVPQSYTFVNPANPFNPPPIETVSVLASDLDFYAIKTGDVNCNAISNFYEDEPDPRQSTLLSAPDLFVTAGQVIDIPIQATRSGAYYGFQVALTTNGAELLSCLPGALPGFSTENIAVRSETARISWSDANASMVNAGQTLFTLRLRAGQDGYLRDVLGLEALSLRPEAYPADGTIERLDLVFGQTSDEVFIGRANPNPALDHFDIPISGASGLPVRLSLYNNTGMLAGEITETVSTNDYLLRVPGHLMVDSGIYYWTMQVGDRTGQGRVVKP